MVATGGRQPLGRTAPAPGRRAGRSLCENAGAAGEVADLRGSDHGRRHRPRAPAPRPERLHPSAGRLPERCRARRRPGRHASAPRASGGCACEPRHQRTAPTARQPSRLKHGLDRLPRRPSPQRELALLDHANLRGARCYHRGGRTFADPSTPSSSCSSCEARRDGHSRRGTRGEPEPCRALPCRVAWPPARPRDDGSATTVGCVRGLRYARLPSPAVVDGCRLPLLARGLDRTLFRSPATAGRMVEVTAHRSPSHRSRQRAADGRPILLIGEAANRSCGWNFLQCRSSSCVQTIWRGTRAASTLNWRPVADSRAG